MKVLKLPMAEPFRCLGHAWRTIPYDAILTEDFNGNPIVTVYYTGYPVMVLEKQEAPGIHDVLWEYSLVTLYSSSVHPQVIADFEFHIGEFSEDAHQRFMRTPMSHGDLDRMFSDDDGVGDGHEWCAFGEAVEEIAEAALLNP